MSADEERLEMNIAERPSDLIGRTPLVSLNRILEEAGVDTSSGVRLVGKMESLNPCSSVKDRLGMSMINEAEKAGLITPGKTVLVEPTSGNTGIALAFLAREKGYRCILTVSVENRERLNGIIESNESSWPKMSHVFCLLSVNLL